MHSPDFFAWMIRPERTGCVWGLCGQSEVSARLGRSQKNVVRLHTLCHRNPSAWPYAKDVRSPHPVCWGCCRVCQTHFRGGSIYRYPPARHAASIAAVCCETDIFTDRLLLRMNNDGRQIWDGIWSRFTDFSDASDNLGQEMDALIRALSDPDIVHTIVEYGDMTAGVLVRKLLLKPAISGVQPHFPVRTSVIVQITKKQKPGFKPSCLQTA